MSKVNPFARALIFTKSGFSGVFWDEKLRQIYPKEPPGPSQSPCGTHINKCLQNDFRLWKAASGLTTDFWTGGKDFKGCFRL